MRSSPTSRLSFVVPDPIAGRLKPGAYRDGDCVITIHRLGLVAIEGGAVPVLTHARWLLASWRVPGPVSGYLMTYGESERVQLLEAVYAAA